MSSILTLLIILDSSLRQLTATFRAVATKFSVLRWNKETFAHHFASLCTLRTPMQMCSDLSQSRSPGLQKSHSSASLTKVRWNCVGMACLCLLEGNHCKEPVWTWSDMLLPLSRTAETLKQFDCPKQKIWLTQPRQSLELSFEAWTFIHEETRHGLEG